MKLIIKLALFLSLVAGLSAGAMSYVFQLTHPIITQAQKEAETKQLNAIYKQSHFQSVSFDHKEYPLIENIYEAKKDEKREGYVYKISTPGYGGHIVYIVALDQSGRYLGYSPIDVTTETSGFGSRVGTKEMADRINKKQIGSGIDTLSGATISSKAVVKGIEQATTHYQKHYK